MDDGQNVTNEIEEVSSNLMTLPFIFKERIDEMVPEYPANSNKSKENHVPLKPLVDEPAVVRKKRKPSKLLKLIFKQDLNDIKPGLVNEYIEPKARELSWSFIQAGIDLVTNALRMMVYEDWKPTSSPRYTQTSAYTYNHYYEGSSKMYANKPAPTMSSELNYDEFVYPTSGRAQAILNELKNLIISNRCATVLDLYELSGITTSQWTLQDWGWTDLSFAEVRQTLNDDGRTVYIIALPKAKPLPR